MKSKLVIKSGTLQELIKKDETLQELISNVQKMEYSLKKRTYEK